MIIINKTDQVVPHIVLFSNFFLWNFDFDKRLRRILQCCCVRCFFVVETKMFHYALCQQTNDLKPFPRKVWVMHGILLLRAMSFWCFLKTIIVLYHIETTSNCVGKKTNLFIMLFCANVRACMRHCVRVRLCECKCLRARSSAWYFQLNHKVSIASTSCAIKTIS